MFFPRHSDASEDSPPPRRNASFAMAASPLREMMQSLLDLIYPPRCEVCDTFGPQALCAECLAHVTKHGPPECERCGALLPPTVYGRKVCPDCAEASRHFDGARSAGIHAGTLRTAVIRFKFENRRRLQLPLAQLLAERIAGEPEPPGGLPLRQVDCLVPIPLHPRRKQWRGFDQAHLLTTELSRMTGLPLVTGLARTRPTTPQLQLAPAEREQNVRGAFAPLGNVLEGKRIVLVDDVYTTGATANQAARAAKAGGATAVYVLTVSRPAPGWHPAAFDMAAGDV
jgi:ComF family protein